MAIVVGSDQAARIAKDLKFKFDWKVVSAGKPFLTARNLNDDL